jgi:enoyl-CoA hydratase
MTSVGDLVAGSEAPFVSVDRGSARFIVINRPAARNALTRQMRRDFPAIIDEAEHDGSVSVLVLTGMDPAFCAGVDLKERAAGASQPISPNPAEVLRRARKPIIAAVNGACVAGGLEMALSCSFIIGSAQSRFADTHAKVGVFPRWGQTALLPNAVGTQRAKQMMLTGAFIDAHRALEWGLINEVTPCDHLLDRCSELAGEIGNAHREVIVAELQALRERDSAARSMGLEAERSALAKWDARRPE